MFRSMFNRVLSIVAWALLAAVAAGVLLTPGALPALVATLLGAAGSAVLVWAVLWSPRITVDDNGVRVVNVLAEHILPWEALIHLDTQYSLTLHTPHRRVRATAAPAPGQLVSFRATRAQKKRLDRPRGEDIRPGDLPGTDSGRASEMVRDRWEARREAGLIEAGIADQMRVTSRIRPAASVAVVLGAGAIVASILSI